MFIYSEKATKFCEIFTLLLTGTTQDKSKVKILQNFVAFSEYVNFTKSKEQLRSHCPNLYLSHLHGYLDLVFSHLHGYQDLHCYQISGFFPPTLLLGPTRLLNFRIFSHQHCYSDSTVIRHPRVYVYGRGTYVARPNSTYSFFENIFSGIKPIIFLI